MEYKKYLTLLQDDIGAAVFSTVDSEGLPQARYINVGVGNEKGIFFMTSPKTGFYQQLEAKPEVSITGMAKSEKGIEVIRVSGSIRKVGKEHLKEILKDNPYVNDVYPDEADQQSVQAFQLFKGHGKYQHLQNKIVEHFEFDVKD
ncbi:pyridoxamine 5'-phosphate oxidase family protein [Ruoffia tabacinasalis]|uniref:Pyridoxamine 5'-phosphate oxidase family protein n=1 Tax=Ruoffia tabacinasalis TaxID=87458 RepID=A0ABS0LIU5_9LACT|nr:pyridoxamine 5'-phosphate oxidase family protein [Ruoffia tabacinasalis]MBG9977369.1 pyridoxamine 5'-phosphate oxidase family protein [Ruoffia tabacinasalis]